jgi:hypothetical protein
MVKSNYRAKLAPSGGDGETLRVARASSRHGDDQLG